MQTNISFYQNKEVFRLLVRNTFPDLVQLKKEGNQKSFNELVLKILPTVQQYVNGKLNTAIKKGCFPKGKYKADDFIDQVFIEIYDNIEEVENEQDFYLWLVKKTNDLLKDVIVEEEFDEIFFKNIDDFSKPEWDEMQEKYSTDGGGNLLMVEDLNDMSYNHNDYTLDQVFIEDNEKDFIEKIDKDISDEEVKNHIMLVLHNLSLPMRNVYDLFTNQRLNVEEIAQIRNTTITEVSQLLKGAKKALQVSFLKRYPQD